VTASVAVLGGAIALVSIIVQRNLARRRAAVDFFLKVEMDEKMMQAFERFESAIEQLKAESIDKLTQKCIRTFASSSTSSSYLPSGFVIEYLTTAFDITTGLIQFVTT
jgi:hypothetical protein